MMTLQAHASVLEASQSEDEFVKFSVDYTYYRFLIPRITQNTNYFFQPGEVRIKDSLFDVFGLYEKSYPFFEESYRDHFLNFQVGVDVPIEEREYV